MAAKKKVEGKKIKGAGKAKPVAKPRKPKLQEMHIETRTVTSHDIFSGMEFKIPVSLIGLTGDSLVGQILEKLDPVSSFRDAVSDQVALLLNRLNEKRTQECITSLQLDVEYQADRDGDYLEFHLNSMVDPKGKPDLPYMTGKMAKQLLETAFERFEIEVDLNGAPAYRQKTEFFYEVLDGTNVRMPAVLDYSDVRELYVAVVHQLYMQMMEGNVIEFFTNHGVHMTPEVLKMMATKIGKEHHVEI
jgi:hypothetical protein